MEKIQQIKEKLERINKIISDPDADALSFLRYHIGNLSKEALALIDEMPKTGVWVEIPKPIKIDDLVFCHSSCPFKPLKRTCIRNWNKPLTDHIGPGCPYYKGEPK